MKAKLTRQEQQIYDYFRANPGKVLSARDLYRAVWGQEPYGAENVVAVHIYHLRRKLKKDPIRTVWRQGYQYKEDL